MKNREDFINTDSTSLNYLVGSLDLETEPSPLLDRWTLRIQQSCALYRT